MSEAGVPNPATSSEAKAGLSFVARLLGVLRLDGAAYEDVAGDPSAMGQAAAVVVAAAVASALSAPGGPLSRYGLAFFISIVAVWPLTSALVLLIGRWFGHASDWERIARVLGFALAPYSFTVLLLVPVVPVQIAVRFLTTAYFLATFVIGVRHAVRTTTDRAAFLSAVTVLVLVLGWLIYVYLTAS